MIFVDPFHLNCSNSNMYSDVSYHLDIVCSTVETLFWLVHGAGVNLFFKIHTHTYTHLMPQVEWSQMAAIKHNSFINTIDIFPSWHQGQNIQTLALLNRESNLQTCQKSGIHLDVLVLRTGIKFTEKCQIWRAQRERKSNASSFP